MGKFQNRITKKPVALVTGAAGHLGRAIVLRLARAGYDLAVQYRVSRAGARALAREAEAGGARVGLYETDLSRDEGASRLVRRVLRDYRRLDLLVNGASLFLATPRGGRASEWERMFRINAVSPYLLSRAAAPALQRRRGSVINLVDTYAHHPVLKGHPAYLASKAALWTLTKVLAGELSPRVRVNAVSPGAITFPAGCTPARRKAVARRSLLKRAGKPEDVAEAVAYLAGAEFMTGQVLKVDGGRFV